MGISAIYFIYDIHFRSNKITHRSLLNNYYKQPNELRLNLQINPQMSPTSELPNGGRQPKKAPVRSRPTVVVSSPTQQQHHFGCLFCRQPMFGDSFIRSSDSWCNKSTIPSSTHISFMKLMNFGGFKTGKFQNFK